jgi:putative IMPACT (imprinted ancient) family translation regulator
VLIVVVRYFGGTKLGTSGLINAYKEASADAVQNNQIVEKTVDEMVKIRFEYPFMNDVMRIVKEDSPTIVEQSFDMDCFMSLSIRKRDMPKLRSRLEKVETLDVIEEEKQP